MSPRQIAQTVAMHLTRFGDVHPMPPVLFRLAPKPSVPVGNHRPLLATPKAAGVVHLPPSAIRALDNDSPRGRVIARERGYDVVEFDPLQLAEWLQKDPRNKQDLTRPGSDG